MFWYQYKRITRQFFWQEFSSQLYFLFYALILLVCPHIYNIYTSFSWPHGISFYCEHRPSSPMKIESNPINIFFKAKAEWYSKIRPLMARIIPPGNPSLFCSSCQPGADACLLSAQPPALCKPGSASEHMMSAQGFQQCERWHQWPNYCTYIAACCRRLSPCKLTVISKKSLASGRTAGKLFCRHLAMQAFSAFFSLKMSLWFENHYVS